jgi:hypothetical protein
MSLELVKLYNGKAVFIDKKRNKIYSNNIAPEAKEILSYFNRIPANF